MTLYRSKYRVDSTRLRDWDYSSTGWYFITVCTKNRVLLFGDIDDGAMRLSPVGEIVADEWRRTEQIRQNVTLDESVVMPNHIHGILVIDDASHESNLAETSQRGVSTIISSSGRTWKPGVLGAIVNQFKSVCTKRIRAAGHREFAWQPRFHDHIIRDERSLDEIRKYIRENPMKWELDRYYMVGPNA